MHSRIFIRLASEIGVEAPGLTLLKLHGSLSWAVRGGQLEKYSDSRPAFRGDVAIIPPIEQKEFANWLHPIWK